MINYDDINDLDALLAGRMTQDEVAKVTELLATSTKANIFRGAARITASTRDEADITLCITAEDAALICIRKGYTASSLAAMGI